MEDDILTQEDDNIEEEMIAEEKQSTKTKAETAIVNEEVPEAEVSETWEAFSRPEQTGLHNTVTGDVIAGFNSETDAALILVLKRMMNTLEKIAISSGA